ALPDDEAGRVDERAAAQNHLAVAYFEAVHGKAATAADFQGLVGGEEERTDGGRAGELEGGAGIDREGVAAGDIAGEGERSAGGFYGADDVVEVGGDRAVAAQRRAGTDGQPTGIGERAAAHHDL